MMSSTAVFFLAAGLAARAVIRTIDAKLLGNWRLVLLGEVFALLAVPIARPGNLGPLFGAVLGLVLLDLVVGTWRSWVRRPSSRDPVLLIADGVFVLSVAVFFTVVPSVSRFAPWVGEMTEYLSAKSPGLGALGGIVPLYRAGILVSGILLSTTWSHYLVSVTLGRFHLMPAPRGDGAARGRVIGYLERAIIFLLIVAGHVGTIGFVIAAKTLARFKELQNKDFAEYFLIGTLISALAALAIGLTVRRFLIV